jgi:hypothetical protein
MVNGALPATTITRSINLSFVVPAKAGTYNHRPWLLRKTSARVAQREAAEYGSLLSQGRRIVWRASAFSEFCGFNFQTTRTQSVLHVIASEAKIHSFFLRHGLLRFARNDGQSRHTSALSRRDAPELVYGSPQEIRGRRECRTLGASAAACAVVESTRVSHHGHAGNVRHSPRSGFNGFLRALPGDRALLPPSSAENSANLMPASGHQDHTTSPSASGALVFGNIRVHRIPPHARDDRETPSEGQDGGGYRSDLGWRRRGIFLNGGTGQGKSD